MECIMTGFSSVSVRGYRRLSNVSLALRPLNVLVGANGVGKSSLLEVFRLLGMSANRRLQATITESGGLQSVLTADGKTSELRLETTFRQADQKSITYELVLAESGAFRFPAVAHEHLSRHDADTTQPPVVLIDSGGGLIRHGIADLPITNGNYDPAESALSQSDPFTDSASFQHILGSMSAIHHSLDVSRRAPVRIPQTFAPAQTPGANGEDLVSCLFTMRETDHDRYEAVEDALRAAFRTFERLEFPPVAAGLFSLGWRDKDFTRALYSSELSEGTLRFLWLATLLQSPGLPKITLIDEPEVSLHPEMLRLLTDLMREASERTLLIVATHADRFVRFLDPSELVACDQDEAGCMTVQRADELDIDAWMQDYTLDQLWSMGRLGGRS
jgi:predicted ATPase